MHYNSTVYRPPRESYTPLLQVTTGCSHNRCTFCNMYANVPFRLSPDAEIIEDLHEIRALYGQPNRVYLLSGDPFALNAKQLNHIIDLILSVIPEIKTITMYASVMNISRKTDEQLKQLRERGINQLYIGLESGHDEVLKRINKVATAEDCVRDLNRLTAAGMSYGVIIMTGIAGHGKCLENAMATTKVMNQISPRVLYCNSTVVMPNTPLGRERDEGIFVEAGEYERLEELKTLVEYLKPKNKLLFNSYHVSNNLNINAEFPEKQAEILARLNDVLNQTTPEEIQREFNRQNMRI